ncbi:MAG: phospho-N-acetylmuramoyl-pentapeptide-transferase [Planctomycetes bacterium]|nr:phospho-N-acetylmuramoyl-pentapeptide-transferase [Planctomycetota bacterium]
MILELLSLLEGTALENLFGYLTFRAALAAVCAFLVAVLCGAPVIAYLRRRKIGEDVQKTDSARLAELHEAKAGTPTMGGVLILLAVLSAVLLFGRLRNPYVVLALLGTIGFGFVGAIDDWIKLSHKNRPGLRAGTKLILQLAVALALALAIVMLAERGGAENPYQLRLPFAKDCFIDLSLLGGTIYLLFAVLVMIATSNAVNLTDGLDGLATGCSLIASATFAVIIYVVARKDFTDYLLIPQVPGAGELTIVCTALAGACLGFLWFNAYPAQVFMGDTGSLPIGGLIGFMAVVARQELVLPIICGVFVLEALSVVLQVGSFKLRGKRIFRIAPVHHHFQFAGWHEVKVVVRFWIIAVIFAILGLATLKVR